MKIGKDAIVVGAVMENSEIGEGSVVITSLEALLNGQRAIGKGAVASSGCFAIGHNASVYVTTLVKDDNNGSD